MMEMRPRRVIDWRIRLLDLRTNGYGTAVADLGRGRYRVQWDEPTPFQDEAKVPIPSADFDWLW